MFGFSHWSSVSEIQQRSSSSRRVCSSIHLSFTYFYRGEKSQCYFSTFVFSDFLSMENFCRCIPYRFKLSSDGKFSDELEILVISSQKGHAMMFPKVSSSSCIFSLDFYTFPSFDKHFGGINCFFTVINFQKSGWLGA